MKGFDEAWLAQHQAKRKSSFAKPEPLKALYISPAGAVPAAWLVDAVKPRRAEIVIRLIAPLMLPNRKNNLHWSAKTKLVHALAREVSAAVGMWNAMPYRKAEVMVWRHGIQEPDADNLVGSLKWLLDVLQPQSKRHPYGIGIISGDDREHVTSEIHHVQCKRRVDQHTLVRIRDLGETP